VAVIVVSRHRVNPEALRSARVVRSLARSIPTRIYASAAEDCFNVNPKSLLPVYAGHRRTGRSNSSNSA
jgi:hypothetical protein